MDIRDGEASIYTLEKRGDNLRENFRKAVFKGDVKKLPHHAYDQDANQLLFMFSPDFLMHIDIDPIEKRWILRSSLEGTTLYKIPGTLLSYNPKQRNEVFE